MTEAIAYFNLAASFEHLQQIPKAIKSYEVALEIAKVHLGKNHGLTHTINDNLDKVQSKQKSQETAHMLRNFMRKEKATSNIYRMNNTEVMYKRVRTKSSYSKTRQKQPASS